jgi:hypothetical protein
VIVRVIRRKRRIQSPVVWVMVSTGIGAKGVSSLHSEDDAPDQQKKRDKG